jgi:hypothetical protein
MEEGSRRVYNNDDDTTTTNNNNNHNVALPFALKSILRQKRRIMETQIHFTMQKYDLQKIL